MHGTHFKHLLTLVAISTTVLPAQSVPTRRAVEVLRLGGEDAPAPFDFAEPARLVVDPAGTVYARLPSDGAILVLGPDGRFVRKIGRNGAGPGEFQSAAQHGLIGDTLWVVNWPTPRISLFSVDGNHISTWNTPFDLGQRFASPTGISGLFPGGRAWVLPGGSPVGVLGRLMLPVLIGNRSMTDPDTVTMVPTPRGMSIDGVGTWAFDPMPSPPLVAVSAIGAGIAVASWTSAAPGRVNIRVVSPSGVELLRRQLTLEAQPVPKKVRDSLLALGVSKARQPIEAARERAQRITNR